MITGGFGVQIDTQTGRARRWYFKHGVKRWFDTDEPVPDKPAVKESLTTQLPRNPR